MDIDAALIARIQFAFTVAFHIIFPAFTIGLASYLAVLQGVYLWTREEVYMTVYKYWLKIFAMAFGMGVVSGIVMAYQFGTNWSVFSEKTGPVLGPLMGYEVLTAFFLEAGFLGIMLFGMKRVSEKVHFAATCMVAFGTALSGFWILSVNSWMNTPTGFALNDYGQFIPLDWIEVIFNPSFPYRFAHMMIAAYLATAFIVGSVGAYHLLRNKKGKATQLMFSMAMWMAAIVAPIQLLVGHMHGENTLEYQPAKIAAMEGHFERQRGAPLHLFGWPNQDEGKMESAISIPKLGSWVLTGDWDGEVPGLNEFDRDEQPNSPMVFFSFRIMVGLGILMIFTGLVSLLLRWGKALYASPLFHKWAILMGPSGLIAILTGWITTEVGRQPYTVYGLLRTSDSISPIALPGVLGSFTAFVIVYTIVFGAGVYYMLKMMRRTPEKPGELSDEKLPIRSAGITPAPALDKNSFSPEGGKK